MAKLAIMQSLRDKLLKAGLVSEDQAQKAEEASKTKPRQEARSEERPRDPRREGRREAGGRPDRPRADFPRSERPAPSDRPARADRPPERRAPQGPMIRARPAGPPPPRQAPAIPKLPPMPGSREYQRLEARKQVELDRKLRELVLASQVPTDIGASVFYFMTRKGKLRRLTLTEPQAKMLENGELAVVERPDPGQIEHALVPPAAAEEIFALLPKAVRFFNRTENPVGFMTDDALREQQEREMRAELAREERARRAAEEGTPAEGEASSAASAEAGVSEAASGGTEAQSAPPGTAAASAEGPAAKE